MIVVEMTGVHLRHGRSQFQFVLAERCRALSERLFAPLSGHPVGICPGGLPHFQVGLDGMFL